MASIAAGRALEVQAAFTPIFDLPPTDDVADELEPRGVDFGNGNGSAWDADGAGADPGSAGCDDGGWG
jgi:hypothetical protein